MTESQLIEASAFDLMRLPKFTPADARRPLPAVLHALPAFLYLALNVWIVGLGLVWVINLAVALPFVINAAFVAIVAVPCLVMSWGLFLRCVETEASINN